MAAVEQLITENLDVWASAVQTKSAAGRGSTNKLELYGIKKLRELILELAVRGLLVPQDPNDEQASELLKKIAAEKSQLVKDGSIKKQKALPAIEDNEKSFELPDGWQWSRLGELSSDIHYGYTASARSGIEGIRLLRITDIQNDKVNWDTVPACEISDEKSRRYLLQDNDILIARTGGTIGKSYLVENIDVEAVFASYLIRVKRISAMYSPYLKTYLGSAVYWTQLYRNASGTGQPNVNATALKQLLVPIPTFEEQRRIVAKVDKLMALCDQLEQQQEASITAHQTLVKTLLDALTTASERDGFTAAWARIADHFDTLFTTEWSIDQLKQTILQLAIMGKLVPQDPNDKPASELLEKIVAERAKLVKDGKIKNQKPLAPIDESEDRAEPPEGWAITRFGNVLFNRDAERVPLSVDERKTRQGEYDYYGASGVIDSIDDYLFDKPLLLIGEDGANLINRSSPIAFMARGKYWVNNHAHVLDGLSEGLLQYVCLHINAISLEPYVTGTAQPKMNQAKMNSIVLAIPPAKEQVRIIVKVDELLGMADKIKARIKRKNQITIAIADAVLVPFAGSKEKGVSAMTETAASHKIAKDKGQAREPSNIQRFALRRFQISSGYRSLPNTECEFHMENDAPEEAEPICLVGLNGSGKSNLIEAVADVFCYLELINLPWRSVIAKSSRYRTSSHKFEVEYTILSDGSEKKVLVKKEKNSGADFYLVDEHDNKEKVEGTAECLSLLPRRIIGYSSGLNETVSHPFLRTRTLYSGEVRDAAPPVGSELSLSKTVFDTNTLYMDYENNAEILLCNFIFRSTGELEFINEFTRVKAISSFEIKISRKIAGKSGADSVARITEELESYVHKFANCAGVAYQQGELNYKFQFELTDTVKKRFRAEFGTAKDLFLAMYKWTLLNALVLSDQQRKVFLREDVTTGALERPPVVPPKDRLFDVAEVKVKLSAPEMTIDYSGLSDGEHQFIQVFGTVLLFSEPGTLFLLDEPESHFNPEWRTKFNNILNEIPNTSSHEFVISTHSPYIVSGSKGTNVFKFKRNGSEVECKPIDFETYGASFDTLLKKLFSIDSLIDESAREELQSIIESGDLGKMEEAAGDFAESREKRKLYEAIIKKKSESV
jgi:type I restriction enzyme S subunit